MTNDQRQELRKKIQKSIVSTKSDIEELKELTKPIAPENSIGRISRMDAINNNSINEAALVQARTKLDKVQFALDKCSEPDFGTCRRCGNAIPMGLLILTPKSYYRLGVPQLIPWRSLIPKLPFQRSFT